MGRAPRLGVTVALLATSPGAQSSSVVQPGTSPLVVFRVLFMTGAAITYRAEARGNPLFPASVDQRASIGQPGGNSNDPGLHFICLGANIARQFEFVQNAWAMGVHFDGVANESDPLLGTRAAGVDGASTDGFSLPRADGPDERIAALPQFVTVLGGAYFFLPGVRALRWLAGTPREASP